MIIVLKIDPSNVYVSQLSTASIVADLLSLYKSANSPKPDPYPIYFVNNFLFSKSELFACVPG